MVRSALWTTPAITIISAAPAFAYDPPLPSIVPNWKSGAQSGFVVEGSEVYCIRFGVRNADVGAGAWTNVNYVLTVPSATGIFQKDNLADPNSGALGVCDEWLSPADGVFTAAGTLQPSSEYEAGVRLKVAAEVVPVSALLTVMGTLEGQSTPTWNETLALTPTLCYLDESGDSDWTSDGCDLDEPEID